jgi:predicted acetyltransferase
MTIEIRPPGAEELRAAMEAAETAFGSDVTEEHWERERKFMPPERALAAYDGGRPVGLAAAYAFDLTIPGGELPCAGVTWVGVMPTHRRRGILRDFMRTQLEDVHGWGEPIAALWASEASIYGRFGYGSSAPGVAAKSDSARFALRHDTGARAAVKLTDLDEALRVFPAVYDAFRARRAGLLSRSETWWTERKLADPKDWRAAASQKFYAVAEVDGRPEGYAIYRVKNEWEDGFARGEVLVVEVVATSTGVELELWRYLHAIDLTVKVDAFSVDPASPLVLGVRDPRALGLRLGDALWLRLVDVEAALEARSYKPVDSVVLEVRDELCPWNAGRYRVGENGGKTDDAAQLALDVTDLASAYLGAYDFHRLARAGLVEERVEGAVEAATILFRTDLPPYCPEVF